MRRDIPDVLDSIINIGVELEGLSTEALMARNQDCRYEELSIVSTDGQPSLRLHLDVDSRPCSDEVDLIASVPTVGESVNVLSGSGIGF